MIYIYNPTSEMAVRQNNTTYQPPKHLVKFEQDLAEIMMFLAKKKDTIIAEKPDKELLRIWNKENVYFCPPSEAKRLIINNENIRPWGESKQIFHFFSDKEKYDKFDERKRYLHSRKSSVELENALTHRRLPTFVERKTHSKIVCNANDLKQQIGLGRFVLKSLWSSSGRGVVIVNEPQHINNAIKWGNDKIRTDGAVIVEPLLERVCEFSFLFEIKATGTINYLGINYFRADETGHFGKELIGQNPMSDFGFTTKWEIYLVAEIALAIHDLQWSKLYHGFVGVDAMAYKSNGKIWIPSGPGG